MVLSKRKIVLAMFLVFTILVSSIFMEYSIVLANEINDYEVAIAESNGTFTNIGSYKTYSEAKTIMDNNENAVIRHNSSKSPMKIIAMRNGEGIVISYAYRKGSSSINNSVINLYPNSSLTNAYTYISSYYDLEYFKTETNYNTSNGSASVQVRISGYKGYVDLRQIDLIPLNFVKNNAQIKIGGNPYNGDSSAYPVRTTSAYQHYYKVSNGELYHRYRNYKSNTWNSEYIIGKAHPDMKDGTYYSFDGINFFYDNELTNSVLDSIGKPLEHYNYFQYLPLRSKTNYSGTDLDNYMKSLNYTKLATSPYQSGATIMHETGHAFIRSQEKYGLNGLMVFSIANHESAYGRSHYAVDRYNLFGWNAIDSNPDDAKGFNSVQHCVSEMMGYNLQGYMASKTSQYGSNREDTRHFGTHVGNKQSGMNVKYASDPYWGQKIAGHSYRADKYLQNEDYNYYTIGVTKDNITYNVRKESNTSNTPISQLANVTFGGIKNMPIIVLNEVTGQSISNNDKWYQFMSNHPLNSNSAITYHKSDDRAKAEVPYNYLTSNAYIHSNAIKLVNSPSEYVWPGKLTSQQELKKSITGIEQIQWNEGKLYIKGYSFHNDLSVPFISVKGENWIKHQLILENESDKTKLYEYDLTSITSNSLNTDSKVYDAAFFEQELDLSQSSIPFGKYNIYIKTMTQGYSFENNLINSNNLQLPNAVNIGDSRFVLENNDNSKNIHVTVSNSEELDLYSVNDIIIVNSTISLNLRNRDNNWSVIKKVNPKDPLLVLDGQPILYNSYKMIKVRTIEENSKDEVIGWVAIDYVTKGRVADYNNNGYIDTDDLIEIATNLGNDASANSSYEKYDLNFDGSIGSIDMSIALQQFKEYIYGDILKAKVNLSLRDDNWNYIKTIKSNETMLALNVRPLYYNGYVRFKIKTNDGLTGWIALRSDWVDIHIKVNQITSNKLSPQEAGTKIRWTAEAEGNNLSYKFYIYKDGKQVYKEDAYKSNNYIEYTLKSAGTYKAILYVKDDRGRFENKESSGFIITSPKINKISTNKISPQELGTKIRWTAETDTSNLLYKFYIYKDGKQVYNGVNYTTQNYIEYLPQSIGSYKAIVYVKDQYGNFDYKISSDFIIKGVECKVNGITTDKSSPQENGTKIKWIAAAQGSNLKYKFYIYKDGRQVYNSGSYISQNYNEYTPQNPGTYKAIVYVIDDSGNFDYKVSSNFEITGENGSLKVYGISADKVSPQEFGTKIKWTASAEGSNLKYKFYVYKDGSKVYNGLSYTTQNYIEYTPESAGSYKTIVYVIDDNGKFDYKISTNFVITENNVPFKVNGINVDKISPQKLGTKIKWTALAQGRNLKYKFYIYKDGSQVYKGDNYNNQNYLEYTPNSKGIYKAIVYVIDGSEFDYIISDNMKID